MIKVLTYSRFIEETGIDENEELEMIPFTDIYLHNGFAFAIIGYFHPGEKLNENHVIMYDGTDFKSVREWVFSHYHFENGGLVENEESENAEYQ